MRHSKRSLAAQLLVGGALVATPMVGLLGAPAPAHAEPCTEVSAELEYTGTAVVGEHHRYCPNGQVIDLAVTLQQKDPVNGTWVTVAQGSGAAGYTCHGHSPGKRYRIAGVGSTAGLLFACA